MFFYVCIIIFSVKGDGKMNILFSGDRNVKKGIMLSCLSLKNHVKGEVNIYILTATVDKYKAIDESFIKTLKDKTGFNVFLFDASENFKNALPEKNMGTRFTPLCMLRLFADEFDVPKKILYLDTDVLCRKDFEDFYNLDISDIELLGVPDRYGSHFFKKDYLNSGVLLMNMENIKKSGLFKKCRKMCKEKKMFMPDQTALNKLSIKKVAPRKFNEQGAIKDDTVFKHFTTFFKFFPYFRAVTIKPWHTEKLHQDLRIFEFDHILEEAGL